MQAAVAVALVTHFQAELVVAAVAVMEKAAQLLELQELPTQVAVVVVVDTVVALEELVAQVEAVE
jgi:hypothetical protein